MGWSIRLEIELKILLFKRIALEFYLVTLNHTLQNSRPVLELDLEVVTTRSRILLKRTY